MRYTYEFTVPADTHKSAPYQERVKLNTGTLTSVELRFLAGCHLRVTFRLRDGLISLVPAAENPALTGNDVVYKIPMSYRMASKPYELILEGTSEGCSYEHKLTVSLDVAEDEPLDKLSLIAILEHLESEA